MGCAALARFALRSHADAQRLQSAKEAQVKAVQKEAKEISRKVDEKGIEQVIYDVTGHKTTPEKALSNAATKGIIDTTAMALDIRTKQLQQVTVIKAALEAENLQLRKQIDANQRPFYTYHGNGLDLKFTPANEADSTSVATADFKANVQIKATQYWKRDWFLGRKKSLLAITSNNPMFKINGADYVEFEQKQPTFGLRIQANSSYNFETGELGYGPAARFDVGRFSFQGRLTKFPNSSSWVKSINASYDLIRF